MPKYCTAPNCKNDSGNTNSDRKSFYNEFYVCKSCIAIKPDSDETVTCSASYNRFPLHDPERLEQWLKNMGREDWIPSRHQYICHEHFTSSCFKLRWGIRYLENDAVPTVFQKPEKRKSMDYFEKYKRRRYTSTLNMNSDDGGTVRENLGLDSDATVQLYEITVDPTQFGEPVMVESRPSVDVLPPGGMEDGYPLALFQTVEDLGGLDCREQADVLVVSDGLYADGQEDGMSVIPTAIHAADKELFVTEYISPLVETQACLAVENVIPETEEPLAPLDDHGVQVIAYFETIPNVLCSGSSAELRISPETLLSSALSSRPIVSTLPIVSKHTPPSPTSLILTLERIETVGEEGERDALNDDVTEQQGSQLEEHRYHKNSLSKEQLEAIVIELQKKVKILQQRHRRHLDKLLGLEATVSQLRQNNLLNEERLQLLERAYLQTSAAVTDAGETVAIIYEDNTAYLYTQSNMEEEVIGWDGIADSNSQL